MPSPNFKLPAGTVFALSSGEYSDYGIEGHFIAIENLTRDDFKQAYDTIIETVTEDHHGDEIDWEDSYDRGMTMKAQMLPQLIRSGKILPLAVHEIHIGSYCGEYWEFLK